jgi:hypothetical protein
MAYEARDQVQSPHPPVNGRAARVPHVSTLVTVQRGLSSAHLARLSAQLIRPSHTGYEHVVGILEHIRRMRGISKHFRKMRIRCL